MRWTVLAYAGYDWHLAEIQARAISTSRRLAKQAGISAKAVDARLGEPVQGG
jgi:hypothetical protein